MSEIYGSGNRDSGGDGYRPPSASDGYRPPSSYDGYGESSDDRSSRYLGPRSEADRDPHYYDGDVHEALARGTTPARQQAWRDARDGDADARDRQDYGDDGDDDPWSQDPDIENYRILTENNGRFPTWAEMAGEHPAQAADDGADPGDPWDTASIADNSRPVLDQASAWTLTGSAALGDHPYPGVGNLDGDGGDGPHGPDSPDGSENTADQDAETGDALRQRISDLEAANARLEARDAERDRGMAELEARIHRLEKDASEQPASRIDARTQTGTARAGKVAKQSRDWKVTSNEGLAAGAAVATEVLAVGSDYYAHYVPVNLAGLTAGALTAAATAVAWWRKKREATDSAHRPED